MSNPAGEVTTIPLNNSKKVAKPSDFGKITSELSLYFEFCRSASTRDVNMHNTDGHKHSEDALKSLGQITEFRLSKLIESGMIYGFEKQPCGWLVTLNNQSAWFVLTLHLKPVVREVSNVKWHYIDCVPCFHGPTSDRSLIDDVVRAMNMQQAGFVEKVVKLIRRAGVVGISPSNDFFLEAFGMNGLDLVSEFLVQVEAEEAKVKASEPSRTEGAACCTQVPSTS